MHLLLQTLYLHRMTVSVVVQVKLISDTISKDTYNNYILLYDIDMILPRKFAVILGLMFALFLML